MILSIVNHKGGTGKTTTTINVGSVLALQGYKVLLVDFDAQASLTYSLGIAGNAPTVTELLHRESPLTDVLTNREGMDILPSSSSLADAELAMARSDDRFYYLRNLLSQMNTYDFILIDCAPSLSLLTLNALAASDYVIVPMHMDVLSLRGLDSMLEMVKKLDRVNTSLSVLGVLPIMVDPRKNMHTEVLNHVRANYDVPVFKQSIRASVKAAEAPSFGLSVVTYAPTSTTATDYKNLTIEILAMLNARKTSDPQLTNTHTYGTRKQS